ncbi:MAG: addiction module protein [Planctomycetota bacterium]|nr:addiction module protein [Planctomycetota bacterium]
MNQLTGELLKAALALPPEARAALAGSLLESLEEGSDPDLESAWAAEIAKRVNELDEGRVLAVPYPEARKRIVGDS